jgi:hypothetical protein
MIPLRPVAGLRSRTGLVLAAACGVPLPAAAEAPAPAPARRAELRVGIDDGDLRGADGAALQAAVDRVAALGGGVVRVGPGRYALRNALTLRSGVDVTGEPGKTVLAVCDSVTSPLACDGDCNERQVTLQNPEGFRVGDGVLVRDKRFGGGFCVTTATLTARVGADTFRLSAPLYLDYMMGQNASASLVFPAVGGWQARDVTVEGLTIDGNRDKTVPTDGCRSGGIYLFECAKVAIRNCAVRGYNGDGISFQVSEDVTVEDCVVEGCAAIGLHPGSGSQRPVVRRNRSSGNGGDGMFVCWRVRRGAFEKNELRDNAGSGISIGHKDSDNVFRENAIAGNAKAGIFFRNETEPMGAHRNVFEKNAILDNGRAAGEKAAGVVIQGHHYNLAFRDNTIGNAQPGGPTAIGIAAGRFAKDLVSENNRFPNVKKDVEQEEPR